MRLGRIVKEQLASPCPTVTVYTTLDFLQTLRGRHAFPAALSFYFLCLFIAAFRYNTLVQLSTFAAHIMSVTVLTRVEFCSPYAQLYSTFCDCSAADFGDFGDADRADCAQLRPAASSVFLYADTPGAVRVRTDAHSWVRGNVPTSRLGTFHRPYCVCV